MSTWHYHSPRGMWFTEQFLHLPNLAGNVETVGGRQAELLLKARSSSGGTVVLSHGRDSNRDRLAARRLVERGLLAGGNYVGGAPGTWKQERGRPIHLYVYALTERGRTCWLRVAKREEQGR